MLPEVVALGNRGLGQASHPSPELRHATHSDIRHTRRYPARVAGARVAIDGTDPIRLRAASALLADHRVESVGLLGRNPPSTWGERAVAIASPAGWELGVGIPPTAGRPEVTPGPGGAVSWAGPTGLAKSLGVRLGGRPALAGTVPGEPLSAGPRFGFPPPLGWLRGELVDDIHHCPTPGSLAAVMATDGDSLVFLDDRKFLDGTALAAGILLAIAGHRGPVWEAADEYLDLAVQLGLVLADRRPEQSA